MDINGKKININKPLLQLQPHPSLKFNEHEMAKYRDIAQVISNETHVPFSLIYGKYPWKLRINNWYKIDDNWYYYKKTGDEGLINELLGEIISEYFGLDTIHYEIASLINENGTYSTGVLSKNFCKKDRVYKTIEDYERTKKIKFSSTDDLSIAISKIKKICHSNENSTILEEQIKRLFIRDFYTTEIDRGTTNLLFSENSTNISLAPLYDYEESFTPDEDLMKKYINCIGMIDINDIGSNNFLKNDRTCQELLNMLMNINIDTLLTKVEENHNIQILEGPKRFYQSHSNKIKQLVNRKIC